jgi:Formin Homology 2 Domain/Subunit CCDC53 of WASH complex
MRSYLPSIKQGKPKGGKQRQTGYAQLSSRSTYRSSNDWFAEVSTSQDEVGEIWTHFCNSNELPISAFKQTDSQRNAFHANTKRKMPDVVFQQHRQMVMQLGNPIYLDPTASTASSSGSQTAEQSPRAKVPITFHFDIDVVKSTTRSNESSQDYDWLSKASSSTISTQTTTCHRVHPVSYRNAFVRSLSKQVKSTSLMKPKLSQFDSQSILGDIPLQRLDSTTIQHANNGRGVPEDSWAIPECPEDKPNIKVDVDETLWINFASDSFVPFEQTALGESTTATTNGQAIKQAKPNEQATCITDNTCTITKNRNPWEKEKSKLQAPQQKEQYKKRHSMHGETSSETSQRNRTNEMRNIASTAYTEIPNKSPSTYTAPGKILDSEATTTPQKSKLGKITSNTMFLSNMLQQNLLDGSIPPTALKTARKENTATNLQGGEILHSTIGIKTKSVLNSTENPSTTIKTPNSLLSSMLQNRKASKMASSAVQKSLVAKSLGNETVPETQVPTTSFTNPKDATGVEWDDLSEKAFTTQLNAANAEFAKYSKMLQVGLPLAVVKNAMQRDGIVLRGTKQSADGDAASKPRFRIPWTVHHNVRSNTLWAMVQRERHWLAEVVLDEAELATWFPKKDPSVPRREHVRRESKPLPRSVIDPKRANNCGILLATIKMSYAEIAHVIDQYSLEKLTLTQMHGLAQCLPTKEEVAALQTTRPTDATEKSECERFMVAMLRVPNAKEKLEAMSFLKRLPTRLDELVHGTWCIYITVVETNFCWTHSRVHFSFTF